MNVQSCSMRSISANSRATSNSPSSMSMPENLAAVERRQPAGVAAYRAGDVEGAHLVRDFKPFEGDPKEGLVCAHVHEFAVGRHVPVLVRFDPLL